MTKREKRLYVVIMCFIFILTVALPLMASVLLTEEWVARYDGQGNRNNGAEDIAIDSSGYIYVTGFTNGDYATVKYDTNGKQLWVKRYNGGACALAVDAAGNVYVTGNTVGNDIYCDYGTIKYDMNGNQLWVARYNGPDNLNDKARAIAIDSLGDIYVTGESEGIGTGDDYATVKYDTNGNQQWVARYNGPGNGYDIISDIILDSSGNVYVTGESEGVGTEFPSSFDLTTLKYDTNGNQQWVARYNGPDNDWDQAGGMALDSTGNVYVTGNSIGSGGSDWVTIKYDMNGNKLWVIRYDGQTTNDWDRACAIALDSLGYIYVTGQSEGIGTGQDYTTIKYSMDGNQLWVARYNGPANVDDWAKAITLDSYGNIYVTGDSMGIGTYNDYATVIYDTDGKELWTARYNGPGSESDRANAIALDSLGNIYVTGTSWEFYPDCATVKYTSIILWVNFSYVGTESGTFTQPYNTLEEAHSVAIPGQIISIKAGETGETGTFDKKVKLVAYGGTVTIGK